VQVPAGTTVAGLLAAAGLAANEARVLVNHEVVTDGLLLLRHGDKVCDANQTSESIHLYSTCGAAPNLFPPVYDRMAAAIALVILQHWSIAFVS